MAETVGQHSVAAFTSPVNGTTPIDANTVRGNDNTVRSAYVDHDADPGIHVQSSSLASRPVAGTVGRKWITVSSGRYQLWYDDGSRWHEVASDAINVDCLADANLTKGDVVKITGFNNGQNLPTVNKVSASTDTAFGIVENTVTSGNIVQIVNTGLIEDVDTNGYAVGTILYPNSSGAWTTTKPTSGNYQPAGYVLRGNTNNGVLYVEFSAPRIVERSDNTASTLVLRDASGNFSAGTITAGALTASGAVSAGSVTSTGLVTFASLKGTGATTVTNILDEDNMASDSATALATQQSIKAYVDAQVATVDTLAEVLANGNTTGANNIIVSSGQKITTNTIDETTAAAGVTIDSVLLKDNEVKATGLLVTNLKANDGTAAGSIANSTGVVTLASSVLTTTDINGGTIDGTTIGGASAAAGTFTTVAGTTGNITTVNATTVDTTNIEVTNIKAKDGTASIAIADSTGVATITAAPVLSALTASQAVFTDASKGLVSNAITGTGNVVMSASPTLTGTVTAATLNATTLGGTLSTAAQPNVTSVGTLTSLTVSGNTSLASSSGGVGIGVAAGSSKLNVAGTFTKNTGDENTWGIRVTDDTAMATGVGGGLVFVGNYTSGGGKASFASIAGAKANSTTANGLGELRFYTTDASSILQQRAVIDGAGNLAVDTNTLYVDAANNRVGVGTATPGYALDVVGGSATALRISGNSAVTNNTAMRFYGLNAAADLWAIGNAVSTNDATRNFDIYDLVAGANRLRLDASGNLGLGVTPSAWSTANDVRAIQLKSGSLWNYSTGNVYVGSNYYWDGTNRKYITSATGACELHLDADNRAFKFFIAPSGTAGNNITFTQAMTLDASGNLGVGVTPGARLTVLTPTSDATVGFNLRAYATGSDGDRTVISRYTSSNDGNWANSVYRAWSHIWETNGTERARITSGGYFKASDAGTYFSSTGSYHELRSSGAASDWTATVSNTTSGSPYGIRIAYTAATPNGTGNEFLYCDDSTAARAVIRSNGGLANYSANNVNLASDERLKKDIAPLTSTWDKLKAIEVVNFRYKDCNEGDPALYGVIAQQVQPIVPELVVVTREAVEAKDAVLDEDGNEVEPAVEAKPEYYGIREQPMYWLAIKALQEAQARIEALEARLEALEA